MRFPRSRILIFAKAPQPGRVKTRLVPPLTPGQAAELHRWLLTQTVTSLARARVAPVELWCAPDPGLDPFPNLAAAHGVRLYRQAEGDLGERMRSAAENGCAHADSLVLVGTDCSTMTGDYIAAAFEALAQRDAVLGPAEDGGYVLLGLKRVAERLFTGIPWGTERVAPITRARMSALGWRWTELPTLWDLDRPPDLERFRRLVSAAE